MAQSPRHFYGLQLDPTRPPGGTTPSMRNGTLVHTLVLEPQQFDARYVVRPDGLDGRTKEGKAWAADNLGREHLEPKDLAAAVAQAGALRELPDVAALLTDGVAESSAFWIDQATGELCKCRPDWTSPVGDGVVLLDVKTTSDASPDGFGRQVWNMRYHLQAAWYSDGYTLATGRPVHGFVFAVVENTWPHCAAAYMLDDAAMEKARTENRRLLDLYAQCKASGQWPGYPSEIQPLTLPAWAT